MGISYQEALTAQREIEDKLLEDPNIVSVGVVEETDAFDQKTGNYAIKVGVISAEAYQIARDRGQSVIPSEYTLSSETGTQGKHVHIKVVKTGQIKALSVSDKTEKNDHFPSATDNIPPTSPQILEDHASRRRPSPCGQSVGHPSVTAGTMGLLVEYTIGTNVGKAYILSNNHVLAANNSGFVGDPILQPGPHDLGNVDRDTIAYLHRWVPLNFQEINYVDAAIAEVFGGSQWSKYAIPYVNKIGFPGDMTDAEMGMSVEKTGRTTGHTQGKVISVSQTVKVSYGQVGIIKFKNQICTTSMSKGGDSGSCLFESGTKKPIGLLFAGDESESFHNPIKSVLSSLSMPHINKYPYGKPYTFAQDHPFKIISRSYSIMPRVPFNQRAHISAKTTSLKNFKSVKNGPLLASFGIYTGSRLGNYSLKSQYSVVSPTSSTIPRAALSISRRVFK